MQSIYFIFTLKFMKFQSESMYDINHKAWYQVRYKCAKHDTFHRFNVCWKKTLTPLIPFCFVLLRNVFPPADVDLISLKLSIWKSSSSSPSLSSASVWSNGLNTPLTVFWSWTPPPAPFHMFQSAPFFISLKKEKYTLYSKPLIVTEASSGSYGNRNIHNMSGWKKSSYLVCTLSSQVSVSITPWIWISGFYFMCEIWVNELSTYSITCLVMFLQK